MGQLQPLLRARQQGPGHLRRPRPGRLVRPPLPADLGVGCGRLRRQRTAAAVPPREPRSGHDLLDRRRPARPAAAAHEPPLPLQPGPRRVLVHSPCAKGAATANAGGVNLAFLGANACYRQIRLQPTSVGPNRLQVCYKDAAEDPIAQPAAGTHDGQLEPGARSTIPSRRSSAPCTSRSGPRPTWWSPTRRRGSTTGATSPTATPSAPSSSASTTATSRPSPARRNADVLAHSPVPGQSNWSDITYYTAPGNGGGVLASGSASFVSLLGNTGAIPPNVIVPRHSRA